MNQLNDMARNIKLRLELELKKEEPNEKIVNALKKEYNEIMEQLA